MSLRFTLVALASSCVAFAAFADETPLEKAKAIKAEAVAADRHCGTQYQVVLANDMVAALGVSPDALAKAGMSAEADAVESKFKGEGRDKFCADVADRTALALHTYMSR